MENLLWLWCEHRMYVVGYVLTVGSLSFAACLQTWASGQGKESAPPGVDAAAPGPDPLRSPVPQVVWAAVGLMQLPWGLHYPARALRFADFLLGGSHLLPEEMRLLHQEQYSLGGAPSWRSSSLIWGRGSGLNALPLPLPCHCPLPWPCPCPHSALPPPALGLPSPPAPTPASAFASAPDPASHPGPGRVQ